MSRIMAGPSRRYVVFGNGRWLVVGARGPTPGRTKRESHEQHLCQPGAGPRQRQRVRVPVSDETKRWLERLARQGDPQAEQRLLVIQQRETVPPTSKNYGVPEWLVLADYAMFERMLLHQRVRRDLFLAGYRSGRTWSNLLDAFSVINDAWDFRYPDFPTPRRYQTESDRRTRHALIREMLRAQIRPAGLVCPAG